VSAGAGEFITQMTATDADAGINGSVSYIIAASHLFRAGSNISSGSVVPSPFAISDSGKLTTESLVAEYNQERFRLEIMAREKAPPFRETYTIVNVNNLKSLSVIKTCFDFIFIQSNFYSSGCMNSSN
jgi:hypothetical protein